MRYFVIVISCISLVACDSFWSNKDSKKNVASTTGKASDTSEESLEARLQKLEIDQLIRAIEKVAYLKVGGDGYAPISFDLGVLTMKLKDVQPYANSTKIQLEIGNPLGATISGLRATVQWGSADEKGNPVAELGAKEISIEKNINAGAWNTAVIILDGTDPKELGFVRIKNVTHTGIILQRAKN